MSGRVCVVTGANSGIGLETARALTRMGADVVLACRNAERGRSALEDVRRDASGAEPELMMLDLSSLASVRAFADELLARHPRLHVLINNAGVYVNKRSVTVDGFETVFGTNHLGPFLLTNLLLPAIRASAPSRIVNVSSIGHWFGHIPFDDLQNERGLWVAWRVYCQSKLANVLFARELAHRLDPAAVTANSLHPGAIATNLMPLPSFVKAIAGRVMTSANSGARTSVHLATSPEGATVTGRYFVKARPARQSKSSRNDALARKLWDVSAELVGLQA